MSNGLAVAAVTASFSHHLSRLIEEPVDPVETVLRAGIVPGARVTTLHPANPALREGEPLVNLYLFRVARNRFATNNDLPTRDGDGRARALPSAVIDLDYMITFFGDDTRLEPHRLLGAVVAGLHAAPALDRDLIDATVEHTPWLDGATLGDRGSPINIMPVSLAPDVMARLWSEFVNTPYQLTTLYTVPAIAVDVPARISPARPVRRIGLDARPAGPIAIQAIVDADHPDQPVTAGCRLALRMADPGRRGLHVRLNDAEASQVQAGRDVQGHGCLMLPLTAAQPMPLTIGRLAVLIRQVAADGREVIAESPPMTVFVLPAIAGDPVYDATGRTVTVRLALPVGARQSSSLLLFPAPGAGHPAGAGSARIPLPPARQAIATLVFPLPHELTGRFLVMVECDGLQSLPDYAAGHYVAPFIEIGAPP